MVHYCVYNSPLIVSIRSQIRQVHAPTFHVLKVIFHICVKVFHVVLSLRFTHQNPVWTSRLPHRCHIRQTEMVLNIVKFLRWGVLSNSPNLQAGGPPLAVCPRLYIRIYPAYCRPLLRQQPETRHVVVTGTHLSLIIIGKWIFNRNGACGVLFIWLKAGSSGGSCEHCKWTFGFHKMRGISSQSGDLLAFQTTLYSMEIDG